VPLILKHISFVNEECIPIDIKQCAYDLCKDIDVKDTVFLSLAFHTKSIILSGDKILKSGLKKKNVEIFLEY